MTAPDWSTWHHPYDEPGSSLHRRLLRVQQRLREALDNQPPGPIRVLSMCAGQGRDLLGLLPAHPRRRDVRAVLVEWDPRNAAVAATVAADVGLDGVEVITGDASVTSAYAAIVPVDVALVCGVFGNVPDRDIRQTVQQLPGLLRTGGTVIWTRHRRDPDLTPVIRDWFAEAAFAEVGFDTEDGFHYAVGSHVLTGPAQPYQPDVALFSFQGDGSTACS
jgi:hypothetical protein